MLRVTNKFKVTSQQCRFASGGVKAFFFGQKQPTSNDEYNTLPPAKPKTDTNANYFQPQIPEIADAQLEIPETSGLLYTPEASSHLDSPEASSQLSTPEVFNQLNTPEDSIQFGTSETSTATPVKTLYEINNQLDQTQTELRALQGSVDKFSQGFDMFKGNLSQLQMAKERSDQIENDLKYLSAGMKSIKALQGYDEKLNSRVKQLENELKTSSNEFISVDKFEAMQMDSSANSAGILARLEKLEAAQKDFPEAQKYCLSETVQLKKRMQKIEETAKKLEAAQKDMAAAQENPLSETVQLKKRMQKIEDQIKQLKEEDVITSTILSNIEYWGKMGFKDEDEMRNFATHLPRALQIFAPEPQVAMHATAEKIVDLFKHLGTEDKKSIMVVFQPIFGRPLSEWNKATAEDKSRSLSDWAYLFMWRLAKSKEE